MKRMTADSSKTFVTVYQTTCNHNPEDHSSNSHDCENLKSHKSALDV
jgi:hypothetical protein